MKHNKNEKSTPRKHDAAAKQMDTAADPIRLEPRVQEDENGFPKLPPPSLHRLIAAIMQWIEQICFERGQQIDDKLRKAWKSFTQLAVEGENLGLPIICAALAGMGKTTWMLAFILALCEFEVNGYGDEAMEQFLRGGVVFVVQRIETLQRFAEEIEKYFPGRRNLIACIRSFSAEDRLTGACRNTEVTDYRDCHPATCPYAAECEIVNSAKQGESSLIVGITQERFYIYRRASEDWLQQHMLLREDEGKTYSRRFLFFDERFDMHDISSMNVDCFCKTESAIDDLVPRRILTDRSASYFENKFHQTIRRPFMRLRTQQQFPTGKDKPFGFCTLREESETVDGYQEFSEALERFRVKNALPKEGQECLRTVEALRSGDCLFVRTNGFRISRIDHPPLTYNGVQTVIFDATAGIDGDYVGLYDERANPFPKRDCAHLTFHVFTNRACNVSKNALAKHSHAEGMSRMVGEIVEKLEGSTYICTNKKFSKTLFRGQLPKGVAEYNGGLPYYGATNGSNDFRECTNVILLGWPRLTPDEFFVRGYASREKEFRDEINELLALMETETKLPREPLRQLKCLEEYTARYITARVEQEIYRCKLREYGSKDAIKVFLFCPDPRVMDLLITRFPGCKVVRHNEVPDCLAVAHGRSRTYGGSPTHFARLAEFFEESWDGTPIAAAVLRDDVLEIPKNAWDDLVKTGKFQMLLARNGVRRIGRGRNVKFIRAQDTGAHDQSA